MKKLVNETKNNCRIIGLGWLSVCLEGGQQSDPKDFVLFDPKDVAAHKGAAGLTALKAGTGGVEALPTRYRLVDVSKFACSQTSDHAAARNHNKAELCWRVFRINFKFFPSKLRYQTGKEPQNNVVDPDPNWFRTGIFLATLWVRIPNTGSAQVKIG